MSHKVLEPLFKARYIWVFIALVFPAVFFRVYPLLGVSEYHHEEVTDKAEHFVRSKLVDQVEESLARQVPFMGASMRRKAAQERVEQIVQDGDPNYLSKVADVTSQMQLHRSPAQSRKYLLEADPYYYLHLTKRLLKSGKLGSAYQGGKFFDDFRVFPNGVRSFVNLHPYFGVFVYHLFQYFKPAVDLMSAVGFIPLICVVFTAAIFLVLCRSSGKSYFSVLIGGWTLFLSPVYIQRSAYGWYDTDPYNILIPLVLLTFFWKGIQNAKSAVTMAIFASVLTAVYALIWEGWPWIMFLLAANAVIIAAVTLRWKNHPYHFAARFLPVYVLGALSVLVIVKSPAGFFGALRDIFTYLPQFSVQEPNLWPNVFVTVGETSSPDFFKLMHLTGNSLTAGFVFLGVILVLFEGIRKRSQAIIIEWISWLTILIPTLYLSLNVQRFSLLTITPLAMLAVMLSNLLPPIISEFVSRRPKFKKVAFYAPLMSMTAIFLCLFPAQVIFAHAVSLGVKPLMNDAWYSALKDIREKTESQAVIYSWWPPGHFITGVAERPVLADGASQHLPECYWLARFFMAHDELEALNILRMLHTGGNQAQELLQSSGMSLIESIEWLNFSFGANRGEAIKKLPAEWSNELKEQAVNLVYGISEPRPSYVLLYNDMIEKALAISYMAGWRFDKAAEVYSLNAKKSKLFQRRQTYLAQLSGLTDGFLKYQPAAELLSKNETAYFFKNGSEIVLPEKTAKITLPEKGLEGHPASLFYEENGQLVEKTFEGNRLNVSMLFFENMEGGYESLLADRALIRSMMFRLYYLDGRGFEYFQLWHEIADPETKTIIKIFKIIWPSG